jgi:tyrosyl-tRNA synthetase
MEIIQKLKEHTAIVLPEQGLEQQLAIAAKEQRPLIIKLGFDPTAPDLHLGHAVVLKKLRQFQQLGHQVVIVVGDFTARIGDPTGKNKSRKPLSTAEVQANAATYVAQLGKLIDVHKARIVFNGSWLDRMSPSDMVQVMSQVTVAQLLQRNDFNNRFTSNTPIALHELVYPVLQGFDSVQIRADIEMGGTDQLFNCTMGRQLQETMGQAPQTVLCMPLLKGLDGKEKMSKSLHNTIGLTDAPELMFAKTMSIPDELIPEWLQLVTDFSISEQEALRGRMQVGENPMLIKKCIAANIVTQYHDAGAAEGAAAHFARQFQQRDPEQKEWTPVSLKDLAQTPQVSLQLLDLCHKLKGKLSRTDIRRLIESGAVQLDHQKITDVHSVVTIAPGMKLRIGKRDFFELC